MHFHLPRRARRIIVGATGALVLTGLAAACNYGPDGDPDVVAFVGSDTTQDVMTQIITNYRNDTAYNDDTNIPGDDRDTLENVLSVEASPHTVAGDEDCPSAITYHSPPGSGEVIAPNGSGAGRDALKASIIAGDGCIDVARSSGAPRPIGPAAGQDPASFEYYAYALDAVGWTSASSLAPANLSLSQLRGVYNCTFTNWSQVGGGNGPIERYYPQPGSGTRSFFQSEVLGFDPFTFQSASCPLPVEIQENEGLGIFFNGDLQTAVFPYSGANFSAMANGTIPDQRAGQTMRNLDGQNITFNNGSQTVLATPEHTGDPNAPVRESNVRLNNPSPPYVGIRYVFNVTDNTARSYQSALRYVGFDNVANGSTSPLCGGAYASTLASFGFGPLNGTDGGANNLAGATCRLF